MTKMEQSLRCAECGTALSLDHKGQCPKCGSSKIMHDVHIHENVGTSVSETVTKTSIREYYERHPVLLPVVLLITFGSPFLGLFIAGGAGVVVGIAVGATAFFLGLKAVTKVREVDRETLS